MVRRARTLSLSKRSRSGAPASCAVVSVLRHVEWDVYAGSKDGRLAVATPDTITQYDAVFYRPMGWKTYEIKDWLGTPRVTFSDIKLPLTPWATYDNYHYELDYLSASTTYPFGARIDSLSFERPSYRFGFTGHLKDNSIRPDKGDGANYSTLFREYDAIIGRWWSADPLRAKYAGMSPYNYSSNNPISHYDPQGSTDYNVGTEEDHETTTIDDGNKDISIYVTKNDLLKQQELWKKDDKLEYERNLDKLSYNNGFTTYEPYGASQYSLYYGMTFLPGLEVTYYAPGHKQYSDYAIEKSSFFYPVMKGNEELIEGIEQYVSWFEISVGNNEFLRQNVINNIKSATKSLKVVQYTFDVGKVISSYNYKDRGLDYYFYRTSSGLIGSAVFGKMGSDIGGIGFGLLGAEFGPEAVTPSAFLGGVIGLEAGSAFGKQFGTSTVDYFYDNWWK